MLYKAKTWSQKEAWIHASMILKERLTVFASLPLVGLFGNTTIPPWLFGWDLANRAYLLFTWKSEEFLRWKHSNSVKLTSPWVHDAYFKTLETYIFCLVASMCLDTVELSLKTLSESGCSQNWLQGLVEVEGLGYNWVHIIICGQGKEFESKNFPKIMCMWDLPGMKGWSSFQQTEQKTGGSWSAPNILHLLAWRLT